MKLRSHFVAGPELAAQAHSITRREKMLYWDHGRSKPVNEVWSPREHKESKEDRLDAIEHVQTTGRVNVLLAVRHRSIG